MRHAYMGTGRCADKRIRGRAAVSAEKKISTNMALHNRKKPDIWKGSHKPISDGDDRPKTKLRSSTCM
jgi:hypothetical protein